MSRKLRRCRICEEWKKKSKFRERNNILSHVCKKCTAEFNKRIEKWIEN